MRDKGGSRRFSNLGARTGTVAMGVLFALLGLAEATSPPENRGSRVFGLSMLAVGLAFGWRGFLSATVIVTPRRAILRGFLRTVRIKLCDVTEVNVATGQTGMGGFGREYLVFTMTDGSRMQFKELNAKPVRDGRESTIVQGAAYAIRKALPTGDPATPTASE
jgi:hypothetical protein